MTKTYVIIALVVAALTVSAIVGYKMAPQCGSSTATEEQETSKNVVTIIKETKGKDGSSTTETTIIDKSKENRKETVAIIEAPKAKDNKVGVVAHTENFREVQSYTALYERRVVGPIWAGVSYNTKQVYGVSLSVEF